MSQPKQAEYAMELKLAAVRRVRAGESVRAVAEELGIRRKRLYVWKDRYAELGEAGLRRRRGRREEATRKRRWGAGSCWRRGSGLRSWSAKWGSKNWNWIFSQRPCGASEWAGSDLHVDRGAGRARRPHGGTNVRVERGKPREILPAMAGVGAAAGGHGVARRGASIRLNELERVARMRFGRPPCL